ncbi:MAG: ABC transporter permease subunit, partial [Terrimesophilobacter sp.]
MNGWELLPAVLKNITGTLALTGAVIVVSTLLALLLTPLTQSRRWYIRLPLKSYTYIGRALPPLTFLFAAFFGLAAAGVRVVPFTAAFLAFLVFATAYNIEILRGGLEAVPGGQSEAARSLGVGPVLTTVRVLFPQALRIA